MYAPFTVKDLNGTVKITSINDIACPSLTGFLNGEKFTSSSSYKSIKDVLNIVFNAELDKFTLKEFPSYAAAETENDTDTASGNKTAGPELLMNIKSNIKVGPISVPYFRSDGFTLNANLTGVSETMKKANGQVSFVLQPGAITDIDSFVKGNKYVKKDNGYIVGILKIKETDLDLLDTRVYFTGSFYDLRVKNNYTMYGELVNHAKYGLQFSVTSYEILLPTKKEEL